MAILERERRGRTEILTLNRPEARNAMSPELSLLLDQAFDELDGDGWMPNMGLLDGFRVSVFDDDLDAARRLLDEKETAGE